MNHPAKEYFRELVSRRSFRVLGVATLATLFSLAALALLLGFASGFSSLSNGQAHALQLALIVTLPILIGGIVGITGVAIEAYSAQRFEKSAPYSSEKLEQMSHLREVNAPPSRYGLNK